MAPFPPNPIDVLVIAPWLDVGGADGVVLDLLLSCDPARVRPHLVTTQPAPNRRVPAALPGGGWIWVLTELAPPAAHPALIVEMASRVGARVVHVANSRLGFDVLPALRALPRPPGVVAHLMGEEGPGEGYPRYAADTCRDVVDRWVTVSRDLAQIIAGYGVPAEDVSVIPVGTDTDTFHPGPAAPGGDLRIVLPARLAPEKDPLLAVAALDELRRRGVAAQLTLTSDGPMRGEVEQAVREMGLGDRVAVAGSVPEMAPLLREHHVALLTSRFEAQPVALAEAMSCGLPVVAVAVGGVPEMVDHEVGALVDSRDPVALADALAALADPARRTALGAAGRARAEERYSTAVMVAAVQDLYEQLASMERAA